MQKLLMVSCDPATHPLLLMHTMKNENNKFHFIFQVYNKIRKT